MDQETPANKRTALMRKAGDMVGSERLAAELGVSPRTAYHWMSGKRHVSNSVLADTRRVMIHFRQRAGYLVALIREEEGIEP